MQFLELIMYSSLDETLLCRRLSESIIKYYHGLFNYCDVLFVLKRNLKEEKKRTLWSSSS